VSTDSFLELKPGLYQSPWQDDFDASRLLIPELFYRLKLCGDPVVAIPNRNCLYVTGAKDYQNLNRLAEIVTYQLEQDTKSLTGLTLTHRNQTWYSFPDSAINPKLLSIWNLNQKWRINRYNSQLVEVNELLKKYQQTSRLSQVYAFELKKNGEIVSTCTWNSEQKHNTLLPEADFISFTSTLHKISDQKHFTLFLSAF